MLDNNVNKNQQQIAFQTVQPDQAYQQQVTMEAGIPANPELLKENIQDTYVANRVANTTDDPKAMMATAGLMLPTWFVLTQAMDKFAKHSRGEYENTLQYKIAKFGDRVADSSLMKSGFMQSIGKGLRSVGKFFKTKIIDQTRLTRALWNTPSMPTNHMAMANYIGMPAMQLFDYPQHGEALQKFTKHVEDLDCYGATKEEIAAARTKLSKALTPEARTLAMQEAECEILIKHSRDAAKARQLAANFVTADAAGKTKILKDLKAFEWGYRDFAHMEKCAKETHKYIPEIFEACCNANKNVFARIWGSNSSSFGRFKKFLFGREVYGNIDLTKPENAKWKEVLERTGYIDKLPKSVFAKYLNKYTHLITEGATNRVAGGKAVALMQAWFIAEALYKSIKAEGGLGEKGKTFAERFIELIAMFACIPLALKLMHSVGGLQYAGMTKEQVAKYRANLEAHNMKAMKGEFSSERAWRASRDNLRRELNAGVKNPFVKLGKRIGRIVSVGLEQIRPYDKNDIGVIKDGVKTYRKGLGQKLKDLFRHPKFGLKQMAGYPMRIGLGMMLIMPFLTKSAVKLSHLIFGKPKHSLLDEDKEKEQAEKQAQQVQQTQIPPQLMQNQNQAVQPQQAMTANIQPSNTNLLNQYKNGQIQPQNINNIQQNSTTSVETAKSNEPVRN